MEFDALTFVLGCVLGAIVGWRVCDRFHQSMLTEILKSAGIGETELKRALENLRVELPEDHEDALPKVEVRIEEVGGSLYAYRVDTDEFLGQGVDATALIARITEINKTNFILVVSKENGSDLVKPAKT